MGYNGFSSNLLKGAAEIYQEAKTVYLLAEQFDKDNDAYMGPINEFRNALDHILRAVLSHENIEEENSEEEILKSVHHEIGESIEHLNRAGYDIYEILCANLTDKIIENIKGYDAELITKVFPSYYTQIKPDLIDTQKEVGLIRANKKINHENKKKNFMDYHGKLLVLIDHTKTVELQIPELEKEKLRRILDKKDERFFSIKSAIIGAFFASLFLIVGEHFFTKKAEATPTSPKNHHNIPNKKNDTI